MRRRSRFCFALAAAAAASLCAQSALAEEPAPPAGQIVLVVEGALWATAANGEGTPRPIAELGLGADQVVGAVHVSPAGNLAVVESEVGIHWVQLHPDQVRRAARAPCGGPVRLAPDGSGFLCSGDDGLVYQPVGWRHRELPLTSTAAAALADGELLYRDQKQLWRASSARPRKRTRVADHAPIAHLLPSPAGDRAVGFYSEPDSGEHIYAFRIDDGRAIRRTLAGPSMPMSWSADGRWLLVRDTRKRACVIRSVGGETLCWNGYTGLAVSADGNHVLLTRSTREAPAKDRSLYVAPILGVSAKKPQAIVQNAWGAAAWWTPE